MPIYVSHENTIMMEQNNVNQTTNKTPPVKNQLTAKLKHPFCLYLPIIPLKKCDVVNSVICPACKCAYTSNITATRASKLQFESNCLQAQLPFTATLKHITSIITKLKEKRFEHFKRKLFHDIYET